MDGCLLAQFLDVFTKLFQWLNSMWYLPDETMQLKHLFVCFGEYFYH